MKRTIVLASLLAATITVAQRNVPSPNTYVGDQACRQCHSGVFERYSRNTMSRSFDRIEASPKIEDWSRNNRFYHQPSNQYFVMTERDGHFFQRRYQLDAAGKEAYSLEVELDYAIGSGAHERDYIHRSASGEFLQLPIVWYSREKAWGMAPGYDRPDHEGFTRRVNYRCVFCHASYPSVQNGYDRSETQVALYPQQMAPGIGCERCHGPGARHVSERTASTIVNPAKLSRKLRMDVCMQCHLETTSRPLPNSVLKLDRAVFSYEPGEALEDYAAYFNYPNGSDEFNIVHQAYRLRKSRCFAKSDMTCLTCHHPHGQTVDYNRTCSACHAPKAINHAGDCISCHMPKRRTDDVVHVVMTDHFIQRRPRKDLLQMKSEPNREPYRGPLAFYLPESKTDLYMGLALARGADVRRGISLLEKTVQPGADFLFQLGFAYSSAGEDDRAASAYLKGLAMDSRDAEARVNAALALMKAGKLDVAAEALREAIRQKPRLADAYVALGTIEMRLGHTQSAYENFQNALKYDPFNTLALNNLGLWSSDNGNLSEARSWFEQVLRIRPNDPTARQALQR